MPAGFLAFHEIAAQRVDGLRPQRGDGLRPQRGDGLRPELLKLLQRPAFDATVDRAPLDREFEALLVVCKQAGAPGITISKCYSVRSASEMTRRCKT